MDLTLTLVRPDGSSRDVPITAESVIGRDKHCALRVPVASVSRRHCAVRLDEDGAHVQDLGSSNGSFVNGKKIDRADLSAGDVLTVGPAVFIVRINGKPEMFDTAAVFEQAGAKVRAGRGRKSPALDDSESLVANLLSDDDSSLMDFEFALDDDEDETED